MTGLSILYYTSNREDARFEQKIRTALETVADDIPIVSVSQKPISLGENICVGDVGASYANAKRQILIAAEAAKTPLVVVAEADCLYPPGYFTWRPEVIDQCYRYVPVWMLFRKEHRDGGFRRKEFTEGAEMVGREFLIRQLHLVLDGHPEWNPDGGWSPKPEFIKRSWGYYGAPDQPMVSIKTGNGMRPYTGTIRTEAPIPELPLWGSADELRRILFS